MVRYGAKALPEGGWHTIPRPYMDGGLIAGDAGGYLNSFRLKGIHLAMRTGMLAAETAFEAVRAGDTSASRLAAYQRRIDEGPGARRAVPGAERAPELRVRPRSGAPVFGAGARLAGAGGSARSRGTPGTTACGSFPTTTATAAADRCVAAA